MLDMFLEYYNSKSNDINLYYNMIMNAITHPTYIKIVNQMLKVPIDNINSMRMTCL